MLSLFIIVLHTKLIFGNKNVKFSNIDEAEYALNNKKDAEDYNQDYLPNLGREILFERQSIDAAKPVEDRHLTSLLDIIVNNSNDGKQILPLSSTNRHSVYNFKNQNKFGSNILMYKRRIGLQMPNILHTKNDPSAHYDPFAVYKRRIGILVIFYI